jgi:two-component system cell cycle response regulator
VNEGGLVVVVGGAPELGEHLTTAGYDVEVVDHLDDVDVEHDPVVVLVSGPLRHVGLRELGPPVIVVVEDEAGPAAISRGAHDVVRAPVTPAELLIRVQSAATATRLRTEVREMARTDPLTGLSNRRFLDDHLAKACSLARRLGKPLSLLMIDIDRTRRINEALGRAGGDLVLAEVAKRVMRGLRGEDVAGRWSGEEFVVLLPHTPVEGAWRLADRIRSSVCDEPIALGLDGHDDVVVTVSIGCAEGFGDNLDEHLLRTQSALDEAKAAGRNKVIAG